MEICDQQVSYRSVAHHIQVPASGRHDAQTHATIICCHNVYSILYDIAETSRRIFFMKKMFLWKRASPCCCPSKKS